jgi:hypothetical protein
LAALINSIAMTYSTLGAFYFKYHTQNCRKIAQYNYLAAQIITALKSIKQHFEPTPELLSRL